ncbi:DUF1993 domain-containing protein [Solimonas flava]|uniref:DUF1993 domain-containing protein n=1 Tax=Solimonas flava TaxID=415849 RepID=UPI00040A545D|nr:DUF1993 domain-containing protein [Solimonas flava]
MTLSMYQASVPVFIRMLGNLRLLLEKGAAYAEARKFDGTALPDSRLFPDMFPLSRQVQIATDNAKGCAARLAGIEPPKFEDSERTIPELIGRIDKTLTFLQTLQPSQIDGSEERPITLQLRSGALNFDGRAYLLHFALPNFYFHVTTAYNLLRHNGVEIGKPDFLGRS